MSERNAGNATDLLVLRNSDSPLSTDGIIINLSNSNPSRVQVRLAERAPGVVVDGATFQPGSALTRNEPSVLTPGCTIR